MTEVVFRDLISKELASLRELELELTHLLADVPDGTLHITKKNNRPQFYQYTIPSHRTYISRKNEALVKQLAQKTYHEKVFDLIQSRIRHCQYLLKDYNSTILDKYDSLSDVRKSYISPLIPDDETFINNWYLENPGGRNSFPITNSFPTKKGELVRSKSEKLIADLLFDSDIPYVYEPKFQTSLNRIISPDFLVLNVRKRETYILEHFGMMGDKNYADKALEKLYEYTLSNIILGKNLLVTFESADYPLKIEYVSKMIEEFLK